jgi:hypothetical protein
MGKSGRVVVGNDVNPGIAGIGRTSLCLVMTPKRLGGDPRPPLLSLCTEMNEFCHTHQTADFFPFCAFLIDLFPNREQNWMNFIEFVRE